MGAIFHDFPFPAQIQACQDEAINEDYVSEGKCNFEQLPIASERGDKCNITEFKASASDCGDAEKAISMFSFLLLIPFPIGING